MDRGPASGGGSRTGLVLSSWRIRLGLLKSNSVGPEVAEVDTDCLRKEGRRSGKKGEKAEVASSRSNHEIGATPSSLPAPSFSLFRRVLSLEID